MKETLQKIREVCIKANPSIIGGLKPGRYIRRGNDWPVDTIVTLHVDFKSGLFNVLLCRESQNITFDLKKVPRDEIEAWYVVPRPIRLADVLVALQKVKLTGDRYLIVVPDGYIQIMFCSLHHSDEEIDACKWNLLDDNLDHQSEETISFIASLL